MEHQDFCLHIGGATPLEKYPAKQHARRVAEFLGVEKGLIYLPGAPTAYLEDSDQFISFRQRRYFYYLSGADEPDCHLTYDIRLDTLMLYVPPAGSPRKVYYNGRGSTPAEALEKYDIDAVQFSYAVVDYIDFWMTQHEGDIYILHPDQAVKPGHDRHPRVNYTKLKAAVDAARVRKDEHEINLIRKANDISAKAHETVLRNILRFRNEAQVEAVFLDTCVAADAKHQAYEIIAASGENAATLHYIKNDEPFGERQVMCLDGGCEWQCYASDVTRTFPLTGQWPSNEAKGIYDLVLKIQTECIEAIRPGARYLDIHYLAHRILIDGLLELGIFHNGTPQDIFDAGTSLAFLPHGLGHHLGLEVHDVSDVPLMAATHDVSPVVDLEMCKSPVHPGSPLLEEGMIVTVEPGIYFNRYALSEVYFPDPEHSRYINREVLLRYLPVGGVRIEDDILVTHRGYENLTTAPKGDEMLRLIQEGLNEASEDERPARTNLKVSPRQESRRKFPRAPSDDMSRNEGIEAWSCGVALERPSISGGATEPTKTDHCVELEGGQMITAMPSRSRPASLSAAPTSFEVTVWPSFEDSVAAELPSEPSRTPQMQERIERHPSHWRKVPPALARMASTQSLSNRSLPEYTPAQMFQRPRQAPAPPQKLPELPAKPLAYRQSMPIIISGSHAVKPSTTKAQCSSTETRPKPVLSRSKTSVRDQIPPDVRNKAMEDQSDKKRSRMSTSDLPAAIAGAYKANSRDEQEQHVTHRASIAIGEQYNRQIPYTERLRYLHQLGQERQQQSQRPLQECQQQLEQAQNKLAQIGPRNEQNRLQRQCANGLPRCPECEPRIPEQTSPQSPSAPADARITNHALQDYQFQLMLLEQQNKKRLLIAREECQEKARVQLEQQNVRRLCMAVQQEQQNRDRRRMAQEVKLQGQQETNPVRMEQEEKAPAAAPSNAAAGLAMVSRKSSPSSYYTTGFDMKY